MTTATGNAGTLSVTIRAVDLFSSGLRKINANALRVQGNLERGFRPIGRVAQFASRNIAAIVPALAAITAAGTIAGMVRLATSWAAFGSALGRTAYRVQTTVDRLSTLQNAARLAGSSAEDLTAGLEGLGGALVDAAGGRDDTAVMYFRQLGIAMTDAQGNARKAADVLPEVADKIAKIADPRLQARVMNALRLPAGLLPFLKDGAAGMREYEAEARRSGATNEAGAEAARRFEKAWVRLQLAGEGLRYSLAERLAPVLVPLMDRLQNWLIANGPAMAAAVGQLAERFAAWVNDGGLQRLGETIGSIWQGIEKAVSWMGGWENAALALGAVLTLKLLSPLTSIVSAITTLGALRMAPWMLRLLGIGGIAIAGVAGVRRAGEMRREAEADTPEAQEQRRRNFGNRGNLGGFPDAPRTDPDAPSAPEIVNNDTLRQRLNDFFGARLAGRPTAQPGVNEPRRGSLSLPRGLRNNNPLNLQHVPGQAGLDPEQPSDGRFGRYTSMEAGVAQAVRQMQIHNARRGDDTVAKLVTRWAPPNENDTRAYIARVAREAGVDPNDRIDMRDAALMQRLVAAMARVENGRSLDPAVVQRGVALALGQQPGQAPAPSPQPGAQGAGAAGPASQAPALQRPPAGGSQGPQAASPPAAERVDIRVRVEGDRAARVTTRRENGEVRVERPMLGAGA